MTNREQRLYFGTDNTARMLTRRELRNSVYAREIMHFRGFSIQKGERMTISDNQDGVGALELRVIDSGGARLVVRLESVETK